MDETWDRRIAAASAARLETFRQLGTPSDDVLAPLIGPALTGGPAWPTRPAWRVVRRDDSLVVASDGLSDPWQDRPGPGYGLEVFIETREDLLADGAIRPIADSWLFSAVQEISNVIAGHGGVRTLLDELGTVSVEIAGSRFPEALRNEHGRVGVLLGVQARGVPNKIELGEEGDAYFVPLTILTREELQRIVEDGDVARREIAAQLGALPDGHVSDLARSSAPEAKALPKLSPKSKTPDAKTPAAKTAGKPASKAPAAKTAGKPAAKTPAAKTAGKPASRTPAAKTAGKSAAKTPAAKATKSPAAKTAGKPASNNPPAKTAGKSVAKKPVAKTSAAKTPAVKKSAGTKANPAAKKKPVTKKRR